MLFEMFDKHKEKKKLNLNFKAKKLCKYKILNKFYGNKFKNIKLNN